MGYLIFQWYLVKFCHVLRMSYKKYHWILYIKESYNKKFKIFKAFIHSQKNYIYIYWDLFERLYLTKEMVFVKKTHKHNYIEVLRHLVTFRTGVGRWQTSFIKKKKSTQTNHVQIALLKLNKAVYLYNAVPVLLILHTIGAEGLQMLLR